MSVHPNLKEINLAVYYNFFDQFRHGLVPNTTTVFAWEADLLGVTQNCFTHEFEIKRSYQDFKADFKKEKHAILQAKYEKKTPYFAKPEDVERWEKEYPDRKTFWTPQIVENIPNYFWFVISGFNVDKSEIPPYAGLILIKTFKASPELTGRNYFVYREIKAPRIHSEKLDDKAREALYRSMCARYWVWVEQSFERVGHGKG